MELSQPAKRLTIISATMILLTIALWLPTPAFAIDTIEAPIGSITTYTYASSVYPIEFNVPEDSRCYVKSNEMHNSGGVYYYNVLLIPKYNSSGTNTVVTAYDTTAEKNDGIFIVKAIPPNEIIEACVDEPVLVDITGYSEWYTDNPISSIELFFSENGIYYDLNSYVQTNSAIDDYDGTGFFKFVHQANISFHTSGTYTVYISAASDGSGLVNTVKTLEITVSDHSFDDGEVIEAATCTDEGQLRKTCSKCGVQRTESIEKIPHEWSTVFTIDQEPTCTTEGKKSLHCVMCDGVNANTMVTVPKVDHQWATTFTIDQEPDCVQPGLKSLHCVNCDAVNPNSLITIPANGHAWANEYTVDLRATCTEEGSESIHCSVCGVSDEGTSRTIAKLGHRFEDYASDGNATCTSDGTKTAECANGCGVTDIVPDEGSALGHAWGGWEVTTQPTCTAKGEKRRTCGNDPSHVETAEVEALGHDYQPAVTPPTCTESGYTTHTCSRCSDAYVDSATQATGHSWDSGVVTKAATYEEAGVLTYTCGACGAERTEPIDKLPRTSLEGATVAGLTAMTYTGEALTPDPTVEVAGKTLTRGTDYSVTYSDNTDAGTATVTITGIDAYEGTATATFTIDKKAIAVPAAKTGLVYSGKAQTGVAAGTGYTVKSGSATNAGSYTAMLTAGANYQFAGAGATAAVKWSIAKKANTLAVKRVKATQLVKYGKETVLKASKVFKVVKNISKGKVAYKKVSGNKKIAITSAGKVTVKKGLKKGTYMVKVKATSKATANYKAASKTVTFKVKVK